MPILATIDQLLGSLLGGYLGHGYSTGQKEWPNVSDSSLYQSWLHSVQQLTIKQPQLSASDPVIALPWLLFYHDNREIRHHWIARNMELASVKVTDTAIHTPGTIYVLGDILEWLMQSSLEIQQPHPLLWEHLQKNNLSYPTAVIPQINRFGQELLSPKSAVSNRLEHHDCPWIIMALAVEQCLTYRENLALALANPRLPQAMRPIVGCLLGAWGGPSIIPTKWIMSLPFDSRQALFYMAQQLYKSWAGIKCNPSNFDVWPLNL